MNNNEFVEPLCIEKLNIADLYFSDKVDFHGQLTSEQNNLQKANLKNLRVDNEEKNMIRKLCYEFTQNVTVTRS